MQEKLSPCKDISWLKARNVGINGQFLQGSKVSMGALERSVPLKMHVHK